jgi:hypothetical protein
MEETSEEFPIYTDPSGRIYQKLQMKRATSGFTEPPPYTDYTFPTALVEGLKQIWKRGWAGLRGGSVVQQGGEWIFQRGKLRYAHRMEGAHDHLTAERLLEILNVAHNKSDDLPSTREETYFESRAQGTEYIYIRP